MYFIRTFFSKELIEAHHYLFNKVNPAFWAVRPLTDQMIAYASGDVKILSELRDKQMLRVSPSDLQLCKDASVAKLNYIRRMQLVEVLAFGLSINHIYLVFHIINNVRMHCLSLFLFKLLNSSHILYTEASNQDFHDWEIHRTWWQ